MPALASSAPHSARMRPFGKASTMGPESSGSSAAAGNGAVMRIPESCGLLHRLARAGNPARRWAGLHPMPPASALRRGGGDGDVARLRLIAGPGGLRRFLGLGALTVLAVHVGTPALVLLRILLLLSLRGLVHRVEDAEIVLGVLEVAFRHHPVPGPGRVAPELEVFLE